MSRQLTTTPSGCSALLLPGDVQTRSREPAMPSPARSVRFVLVVPFFRLVISEVEWKMLICSFLLFSQIRRKMREIMINQATSCDLKDLVNKFIPEMIGREIEKATSSIYPLQNVFIRKVKILKAPKFDLGKLMEVFTIYPLVFSSILFFRSYHILCWGL